jgi:uncharacterized protein (UPF0335 family)
MAMALPLGKITILVGAGIMASVLAEEGRVSHFLSGAIKTALKGLKQSDSALSTGKPRNDALLAQVNSLREELQLLASSRPMTIITSTGSGGGKYGAIVIVIVVGSGYVWWKGWKLPDMMFASKRSLSDACTSIAGQLETVYSSISAAKRHLSSRIEKVDKSLDECAELTSSIGEEVTEIKSEVKLVGVDVRSVHHAVQTLETKISKIQGNQAFAFEGVKKLVAMTRDNIQVIPVSSSNPTITSSSSKPAITSSATKPAIELPPMSPSSRAESLPSTTTPLLELPSSSSSNKGKWRLHSAASESGLKELNGILNLEEVSSIPDNLNVGPVDENLGGNGSNSSGIFSRFSGYLTRSRSALEPTK